MNLSGYFEKHFVTIDFPLTLSTTNLPVSIFYIFSVVFYKQSQDKYVNEYKSVNFNKL